MRYKSVVFFVVASIATVSSLHAQWVKMDGPGALFKGLNVHTLIRHKEFVVAGTDSGVCITPYNGTTWFCFKEGLPSTNVYALATSGEDLYVGTDSGVARSSDNGETWERVSASKTYALVVIDSFLFAGTDSGVFRTSNKGLSWVAMNNWSSSQIVKAGPIKFPKPNTADPISSEKPDGQLMHVRSLAVDGKTLYAGTSRSDPSLHDGHGLFRSVNEGASWSRIGSAISDSNISSIAAQRGRIAVVTLSDDSIPSVYTSTNKGSTWLASAHFSHSDVLGPIAIHDSLIFFSFTYDLTRSSDEGHHWQAFGLLRDRPFRASAFATDDSTLYAADPQGLVWNILFSKTELAFIKVDRTDALLSFAHVFPNPVTASATISFSLAQAGKLRIHVIDMLGREVATIKDEDMDPGLYSASWSAGGIPSGGYQCIIEVDGKITALPLIVAK